MFIVSSLYNTEVALLHYFLLDKPNSTFSQFLWQCINQTASRKKLYFTPFPNSNQTQATYPSTGHFQFTNEHKKL